MDLHSPKIDRCITQNHDSVILPYAEAWPDKSVSRSALLVNHSVKKVRQLSDILVSESDQAN